MEMVTNSLHAANRRKYFPVNALRNHRVLITVFSNATITRKFRRFQNFEKNWKILKHRKFYVARRLGTRPNEVIDKRPVSTVD